MTDQITILYDDENPIALSSLFQADKSAQAFSRHVKNIAGSVSRDEHPSVAHQFRRAADEMLKQHDWMMALAERKIVVPTALGGLVYL